MAGPADEHDLTIDIDEHGQLHIGSRAVTRRLAAASGRWRMVPSTGDLLILQRAAEGSRADAELSADPGAVALCGEIDGPGALPTVLNFVHFSQWDGTLAVLRGMVRKQLFFQRGQLLAASSNLPEDR